MPKDDPLKAALARLVSEAQEPWGQLQGETPELLNHYTDISGLIGICSSRSLWGTHLQFMNDASDLAHAWKLMLSVLADTRALAQSPAQIELIDEIGRAISSQWAVYPDFYSVSFCADGDPLGSDAVTDRWAAGTRPGSRRAAWSAHRRRSRSHRASSIV